MPYIKKEDRLNIATSDGYINYEEINCAGDMQYAIAVMVKDYMERKGLNYQHCNDILGALDGASREFYRRTVASYEDEKMIQNGDVE